jgi:hypothetical protein
VCLPSAASSPATTRSCQALPCGSLRESCRTRAGQPRRRAPVAALSVTQPAPPRGARRTP